MILTWLIVCRCFPHVILHWQAKYGQQKDVISHSYKHCCFDSLCESYCFTKSFTSFVTCELHVLLALVWAFFLRYLSFFSVQKHICYTNWWFLIAYKAECVCVCVCEWLFIYMFCVAKIKCKKRSKKMSDWCRPKSQSGNSPQQTLFLAEAA